jgi:3-oxoacyl-[acyl-carrier protein] reductase
MNFENKNILIVGASAGIGEYLAQNLLKDGANIYSISRSKPNFEVNYFEWDASNPNSDFVEHLPEVIHALVYCPGTINLKPANRLTTNDFQNDLQINFLGLVYVFNAIFAKLKKSNDCSIVTFSTVAAKIGMPYHASIAASKAAVEGFTKSIAAEFANINIRANCIAPSLTDTTLAKALLSTPEKQDASAKRHPLGRIGEPKDIASMAKFLLSDDASWITGQVLHVDGGISSIKNQ